MNILNYFVEANLCLAVFYILYRLFLYHETGVHFNRMFLLSALASSVIVPFLRLGRLDEIPAIGNAIPAHLLPELTISAGAAAEHETAGSASIGVWVIIAFAYLTVAALLLFRLLYRYMKLRSLVRSARLLAEADGTRILAVDEPAMAFSFFRHIVIGAPSALSERERELIVSHESVHVKKGHTWDILLAELLCIVFWFNPAVWAMRARLGDVHEFEADQAAAQGRDLQEYCSLLARVALQSAGYPLATHFNRSLTLKRIHMIKSAKNKISRWKIAALLPAIAGVIGFVACQDQMMDDFKIVADNSSMALNAPSFVQKRYDELTRANPDVRYVIIEVQQDGQEKLTNLEKEYGLPSTVEVFNADGTTLSATPFQDAATHGNLVIHETEYVGNATPDPRMFAILEYDERVQALSQSTDQEGEVFLVVEETAQPKDGIQKLFAFLAENISYPTKAREAGVAGRVFIEFTVEKDGTLTDFKAVKGIGYGCDEEAIRVLKLSPPWNPGMMKGKPVRQKMVLPVHFNL